MKADYLVHGNLVLPHKVVTGTLVIGNGRIQAIQEEARPPAPAEATLLDVSGRYVLPGAIEVHGHMREPGLAHKEDYTTGTKAAVAGGVTTILDMPNTQPPTTTPVLLEEKIKLATGRAHCDFGLIMGGANDNLEALQTVDTSLIVGVKFFMAGHETTPTTMSDLGRLYQAFEILGQRDLPALVHAENQQLINHLAAQYMQSPGADGLAYSRSRDEIVVTVAAWDAIHVARVTGTRLYICHMSTAGELEALRWARSQGQDVYGEIACYHLAFTTEDYGRLGTRLKVSPALRAPHHRETLWQTLLYETLVDAVCSEHSPHLLSEKTADFAQAASGMPGIQEYRAVLLTELLKRAPEAQRDDALVKLGRLTATHIADIFRLQDKGSLAPGKDADLVVVDLAQSREVRREQLFAKCGWSAYEGQQLRGMPELTMLRGTIVYAGGEIKTSPLGRLVQPSKVPA